MRSGVLMLYQIGMTAQLIIMIVDHGFKSLKRKFDVYFIVSV